MIFVLNENIIKKKFTIHKRGDVWMYSIDNSSLKQLPNRDENRPYIINFQVSIYLNVYLTLIKSGTNPSLLRPLEMTPYLFGSSGLMQHSQESDSVGGGNVEMEANESSAESDVDDSISRKKKIRQEIRAELKQIRESEEVQKMVCIYQVC